MTSVSNNPCKHTEQKSNSAPAPNRKRAVTFNFSYPSLLPVSTGVQCLNHRGEHGVERSGGRAGGDGVSYREGGVPSFRSAANLSSMQLRPMTVGGNSFHSPHVEVGDNRIATPHVGDNTTKRTNSTTRNQAVQLEPSLSGAESAFKSEGPVECSRVVVQTLPDILFSRSDLTQGHQSNSVINTCTGINSCCQCDRKNSSMTHELVGIDTTNIPVCCQSKTNDDHLSGNLSPSTRHVQGSAEASNASNPLVSISDFTVATVANPSSRENSNHSNAQSSHRCGAQLLKRHKSLSPSINNCVSGEKQPHSGDGGFGLKGGGTTDPFRNGTMHSERTYLLGESKNHYSADNVPSLSITNSSTDPIVTSQSSLDATRHFTTNDLKTKSDVNISLQSRPTPKQNNVNDIRLDSISGHISSSRRTSAAHASSSAESLPPMNLSQPRMLTSSPTIPRPCKHYSRLSPNPEHHMHLRLGSENGLTTTQRGSHPIRISSERSSSPNAFLFAHRPSVIMRHSFSRRASITPSLRRLQIRLALKEVSRGND